MLKQKNKVVLFQGKASSFDKKIGVAPLAILHVSSFLVKDGMTVKVISDALYDDYIEEAVRQCEDSICVGITAMTGNQILDGLKLSSEVRRIYPNMPIVWGGWHPSIMPESTLEDQNVDIVIRGQGEKKFYDLVKYIESNRLENIDMIPGLCRKNNGQLIIKDNPVVENMNSFPAVPYDIIDVQKCISQTEYGKRTLQYISSYGCPFRCSFCIEPVVSKRKWSGLDAARVVDEWGSLYRKYKIDSVAVYDSNFFVDKKRVISICEGLLKNNIKIKIGNLNGRIPQLVEYEKEVWQLMERAGFSMILTGSESGEQEVLDQIKKDANIEDIYKFTQLCHEHNIKILFSYMSGIPWSKDPGYNRSRVDKEISGILSQVDELLRISPKNRFMIYVYNPLPGSELFYKAIECGFQPPKTLREWSRSLTSPEDVFQDSGFNKTWIAPKQLFLITMLEQYIFGMMDLDAKEWIGVNIKNRIFRFFFRLCFTLGYYLAKIRLKFKVFMFPVDYWIFIKIRKLIGA